MCAAITSFFRLPMESELQSIDISGSSKGNQRKYRSLDSNWYFKQNFYYQDKFWRDDLVEVIASQLGNIYMTIDNCEVLQQFSDYRFGHHGVFSRNFLDDSESYIPFSRLCESNSIEIPLNKGIETFDAIRRVYELCQLDATDFLIVQSLIDYLVGNEDRHLNNFGVIQTSEGFRLHPLFDFGLGMFEHDRLYEDYTFKEKLEHVRFKTFGSNQYELIQQLQQRYPNEFSRLLNWTLQPSKFNFPSIHAESYLRYTCGKVGIKICND